MAASEGGEKKRGGKKNKKTQVVGNMCVNGMRAWTLWAPCCCMDWRVRRDEYSPEKKRNHLLK